MFEVLTSPLIKTRPSASFLLVALLLSLLLSGCREPPKSLILTGKTMGTTYRIILAKPDTSLHLKQLQESINNELVKINQLMSTYIEDSEISRFNRATTNEWFQLSPETYEVLNYSLSLSAQTEGKFDITVGPLINLWGFGYPNKEGLPSDIEIAAVMPMIGWQFIELNPSVLQARKNKPLSIDMSAVAKGYGVDHIAALLDKWLIKDYLVEIGGEIKVKGTNNQNQQWRIGIETPSLHQSGAQQVIALNNRAVATSGDYRNFFEKEGVRYSHTIDPMTGKPVVHNIASLTVISNSAMEADGLATALMAMGEQKALGLSKKHNIPIYILLYKGKQFTSVHSPAFAEYLSPKH
ncbi:hypothetical protein AB835_02535 [Candidatus Endobugula sertula]|uniref:FAD:protein FMN transferase n=1 Tax=Candidatus Endobugula sertula TaxID=62101 RepID=A0A1D2QSR0_9GAMM|nr:hypothetical protein AB835_02535 [Candidatus Endobugula sertula]